MQSPGVKGRRHAITGPTQRRRVRPARRGSGSPWGANGRSSSSRRQGRLRITLASTLFSAALVLANAAVGSASPAAKMMDTVTYFPASPALCARVLQADPAAASNPIGCRYKLETYGLQAPSSTSVASAASTICPVAMAWMSYSGTFGLWSSKMSFHYCYNQAYVWSVGSPICAGSAWAPYSVTETNCVIYNDGDPNPLDWGFMEPFNTWQVGWFGNTTACWQYGWMWTDGSFTNHTASC
jgi:hypothetical protein